MKRGVVLAVAALVATCKPAPPSKAEPARLLVVLSIDGLRHDYLDDRTHAIPNLRRLREQGAHANSVRSVWPTVTYPAHTTLVTGVRPIRHGIINNVVFDPFDKNDGGWYWYASDIKVPTLWDVAADAGIAVVNEYWPVTVGARIDANLPQFWRAKNPEDEKLLAALSTPNLYSEIAHIAPPPGEHRDDRARTDAALYMLRTKRPGLALAYLTDLDTVQHDHGPGSPEAWSTLEQIDGMVGEIAAAAAQSSPLVTLAIVSDHGFLPVDTDVRPNVALRAEGLLRASTQTKDGKTEDLLDSYDAITWKSGATAAIMGLHGRDEPTASQVKALFTRLAADPANRIANVYDGARIEREGGLPGAIVVLEAARGATFSGRFDGPMVAPSHYRGMHGYSPAMPEMGASFVLWGDGVKPGELGDIDMLDIAPTLAALLGVSLPSAEGKPLATALQRRSR